MTFYWWSHWFWITLLTYFVIFRTAHVHTYPRQEISNDSPKADTPSAVTRLYQTATSDFPRSTAAPHDGEEPEEEDTEYPQVDGNEGDVEMESPIEENGDDVEVADFEFKRSAEVNNKTTHNGAPTELARKTEAITAHNTSKETLIDTEISNYTNFSRPNSSVAAAVTATLSTDVESMPLAAEHVEHKENVSSTLAWLNAVAAVTVSEDRDPEAIAHKAPFTLENVNKEAELLRAETEHRTRKSKVLSAEYKHLNRFTDSKNLLTRSAATATATSPNQFDNDGGNISSEALAIQRTYFLDAGAISAICFTVFGFCCVVATIGIVLYRRRFLNKPQALSEPDSSVYIDDSTMRVSDNSDEMYSLDNDSFLNSLEAMTIQNYWTDTVKHTKL